MTDPLAWVSDELAALDRAGLRRTPRVCRALPGGRVEVDGRELWNFGSNDYLGLANSSPPKPRPGRASALGAGATASPAVTGRSPELAELERTLAEFEGTDDAVVFPTGYAANLGTVAALTGPGDAVFVERDCHACLVDGAKLGGGRLRVWRRDDPVRLGRELTKAGGARRRWIVTERVFGMDGDCDSLRIALRAAERSDAVVICDHAHATGTHIANQAPHRFDHRHVRTGTLSKAVGAAGGFVVGAASLCDLLRHTAKSHIFSTALAPAIAAAAAGNLHRMRAEPDRQERLRTRTFRFRQALLGHGLKVLGDPICHLVPVLVGDPAAAVRASAALAEAGFFVPAIRPPTVRRGTSRLRVSLSAAHPDDAVDGLADALLHLLPSFPKPEGTA